MNRVPTIQVTQRSVEVLQSQSDDRVADVLVVRQDFKTDVEDESMSKCNCVPVCDGESCVNNGVGDPNQHGMTPQTD